MPPSIFPMEILFGWELDGAPWLRGGKQGTIGEVTVGPRGLTSILGTRLGITAPEIPRPRRVAAYRRALEATAHPWCAQSMELDGWATASQLLSLRDELAELGWVPRSGLSSPRLAALALAEVEFTDHPGVADCLRDIARELHHRANVESPASVGIDSLTVLNRSDLPAPWSEIITSLHVLGVEILEPAEPEPVRSVRIISAATEWQAAETAARILATDPARTLLSTSRTDALDQELARRGLPRVGRSDSSDLRATAQIVPLFLNAVTAPINVNAVAAVLDLGLSTTTGDEGGTHAVRLVPSAVRYELLRALIQEPGVGGGAWAQAVGKLKEEGFDIADDLTHLFTTNALSFQDGLCPTADIIRALTWLQARLRKIGFTTSTSALTRASESVNSVIAVLQERESVSQPELQRIITDCCPPAASPLSGAEATNRPTVTSPSQLSALAPAPVLWWGAIDNSTPLARHWTPAEVRELAETAGVIVPSPTALAALSVHAQLRGVRSAGDVVAVVARSLDGEPTLLDPLLDFAVQDAADGDTPVPDLIKDVTTDAAELVSDGSWMFSGQSLQVTDPVAEEISVVDPVLRHVRPGTQLLPEKMSYSQMEKLLIHRLEWLLSYPLGIRPGQLAQLPAGNQLVGTFEHAIVEELVHRHVGEEADLVEVSEAEVADVFDEMLPYLASELLLPGQSLRREQLRTEALESIPSMFRTLSDAGIRIRAVEADFAVPLTLTLTDPNGSRPDITHSLVVSGFRDLDAVGNEGLPVVVDLKYSGSKRKFRESVQNGRSLQLALYAWSVADQENLPLAAVTTAYYELKYGKFNSVDPRLGGITAGGHDTEDLWAAAKKSLSEALAEIAFDGTIHDVGNGLISRVQGEGLSYSASMKAAEKAAGVVHDQGGFLPVESFTYTDYGVLTGIEGDFR